MICYHHNDLDGRCAAAIVLMKYPECRTREINYKDDPCFKDEVQEGEVVFVVDFSFKPEKMSELFKVTSHTNIIWIDHHKTAIDYRYFASNGIEVFLAGKRDYSTPGKSGCELTWEYIFQPDHLIEKNAAPEMPEAVRLIGDYDTWRFDTEDISKIFYEGLKIFDNFPQSYAWTKLFDNDQCFEVTVQNAGINAIQYRDKFCYDYREAFGWKVDFEGYDCYAMNLYKTGSLGFGEEMEEHDICIACVYSAGKWTVSLYSTKIDVSIIAKKYGGGGHEGAAGFICKELPF